MYPFLAISFVITMLSYFVLQTILFCTQNKREPELLNSTIPFLDASIGIIHRRATFWTTLCKYRVAICTIRLPFKRVYVINAPKIVHDVQKKTNAAILVPNLLDFGMLFSALNNKSQSALRGAFIMKGNTFTTSAHRYLLSGSSLHSVTRAAIDLLSVNLPDHFGESRQVGLLELVQHELTLAFTGAVYGPKNPFYDLKVEESWREFVPGISHLIYSPFPSLTARKALRARCRVIEAFQKYFETDGHLQAFPMIPEMYEINKSNGLCSKEAAKMEIATSLAMLSSGAITSFWLIYHIFSDPLALRAARKELHLAAKVEHDRDDGISKFKVLNLNRIKGQCPTLVAMFNETLRYHSTVLNIKQVKTDTTVANRYLLKKNATVMIPGQIIHHSKEIWGLSADVFDHLRFRSSESRNKLASTSAFRPFGGGTTMCPGRHFSTNVLLSLVAMIVLQYNIMPEEGQWIAPTIRKADMWNAMPKPDLDINVRLFKESNEKGIEWKFVWVEKTERNEHYV